MADFQPFRGLRYDRDRAGALGSVIAPPYDVISPAQQQALYELSPYNVVRIEYGREQGAERTHGQRMIGEAAGHGGSTSPSLMLGSREVLMCHTEIVTSANQLHDGL